MSRIKELQKQIHHILEGNEKEASQIAHLHGVALAAAILAKKRGEDAEIATMAGLLHDLYAYKAGSYDDHARLGADYAGKVLKKLGITSPEETEIICSAIRNHDGKDTADAPMDEILKDADVLHHTLGDPAKEVKAHEKARYEKLCAELGMCGKEPS